MVGPKLAASCLNWGSLRILDRPQGLPEGGKMIGVGLVEFCDQMDRIGVEQTSARVRECGECGLWIHVGGGYVRSLRLR